MVIVAACPGFKVSGRPIPESENIDPATDAALIVSGPDPDDVSVTAFVVVEFSATVPNATLLALTVSAGVVVPPVDGLSFTVKLFDTLPDFAVMVTVCADLTAVTGAVNWPLLWPVATTASSGTATALLLLFKSISLVLVVAPLSVTVQVSVPAPLNELLEHDKPVICTAPNEARGRQAAIRQIKLARNNSRCRRLPR